jgi:hypothetical protein
MNDEFFFHILIIPVNFTRRQTDPRRTSFEKTILYIIFYILYNKQGVEAPAAMFESIRSPLPRFQYYNKMLLLKTLYETLRLIT